MKSGFSLGLLDSDGQQMNTHIPGPPVSMGPADVTVYAMLASDAASRRLGSIIDFLNASGVVLNKTQQVIRADSLLPDIQEYVDWSFQNRNDPKATLGLLLAAGPTMILPESAPSMSQESRVSPLAGILLMADILIGVPENVHTKTDTDKHFSQAKLSLDQSSQVSDTQNTAQALQGLVTAVSPFLPGNLRIPDVVNTILAAFALGDRIVLRTVDPADIMQDPMQDIRQIELQATLNQGVQLVPVAMLIPSRIILQGVQMDYTIDLVSPSRAMGSAAGSLYSDADAQLQSFQGRNSSVQMDGHRLQISGRPPLEPAGFSVIRTQAQNEEKRAALLYATAEVELPQLTEILAKYDDILSGMGFFAQVAASTVLPREKAEQYYRDIESGLQVGALAYPVILLPQDEKTGLSFDTEGTMDSGLPIRFKPQAAGMEENWPAQYEWMWEWGDGTSESVVARSERPIHTSENPGQYTVQLQVSNAVTKEILASGEQLLTIKDLPAITERTDTSVSYHIFEEHDAQIPVLLGEQMSLSELWRLNLCSFEAPEPSWTAFPTLRAVYKGKVLNYTPADQPPVYLTRTVRMQIRFVNELSKEQVHYTHGQDTGTLIGNEWILATASAKKQYDQIMQMSATNQQTWIVESNLDENHMQFIYMSSPKSDLQMKYSYTAAHIERFGSCIIEINMNFPCTDDGAVKEVMDSLVEYARNLASKAESYAGRYTNAFTQP